METKCELKGNCNGKYVLETFVVFWNTLENKSINVRNGLRFFLKEGKAEKGLFL